MTRADELIRSRLSEESDEDIIWHIQKGGDFGDMQNRAWVSPAGEIHKLNKPVKRDLAAAWDGQFPAQTHIHWAVKNQNKVRKTIPKDQHKQASGMDVVGKMMEHGWIRKMGARSYAVHSRDHLPAVQAHIEKHHPETKSALVLFTGQPKETTPLGQTLYDYQLIKR